MVLIRADGLIPPMLCLDLVDLIVF